MGFQLASITGLLPITMEQHFFSPEDPYSPPPHKGLKAQSQRLMQTLTLPRLSSYSLLTHDPAQLGLPTEATFQFSPPTSFLRGKKPVTSSCEAAPRPQARPGSRWSGPTHATGLSASPTRERSRPEKPGDFLVSFLPLFLTIQAGHRAPVPEARPPPCRPPLPFCPPHASSLPETPSCPLRHRPSRADGAGPAPTSRRDDRYLLRAVALAEMLSAPLPECALPGPTPHPNSGTKRAAPVGRCAHGTRPPIGSRLRRSEGRGRRGLAA